MSQQKVDYHKEQKRNRRQIMKREKAMRRLEITVLIAILVALIAWFSYMVYRNMQAKYVSSNAVTKELDLTAWEDYTGNLDALINGEEESEEAEATETEEESEETEEAAEEEDADAAEEEEEASSEDEAAEGDEESSEKTDKE